MTKKELGQFYTTNAEYIIGPLVPLMKSFMRGDPTIVDPFVGNWDLLNAIEGFEKEGYDIDPKTPNTHTRDSILNPIDYTNKWVVTNPPYLARNKTCNKAPFEKYEVDDLYKAALRTFDGAEGGVVVVPFNFFTSQEYKDRAWFMDRFRIVKVIAFEEAVFDDTDYTVCTFLFVKRGAKCQNIEFIFMPSKETLIVPFSLYTPCSAFWSLLQDKSDIKVGRLREGQTPSSSIILRALDTGSMDGRIGLSITDIPFFGKNTDRTFASITLSRPLSKKAQEVLVREFNSLLEENRQKYHSMFLNGFMNSSEHYARKRIGFDVAYALVGHIIKKHNLENV